MEDGAGGAGPVMKEGPEAFGHGEDELAHRYVGNDVVHQVGRRLGHALGPARGTGASGPARGIWDFEAIWASRGSGFSRPRDFESASSAPRSRCLRQADRWEVYSPSRRSRTPISPGFEQASACRSILSFYWAGNVRRRGRSTSSGSGADGARPTSGRFRSPTAPSSGRLAPPFRAAFPFLFNSNISWLHSRPRLSKSSSLYRLTQ